MIAAHSGRARFIYEAQQQRLYEKKWQCSLLIEGKNESNFIFIYVVILFFQSLADPLLLVLSTNVTSGLLM